MFIMSFIFFNFQYFNCIRLLIYLSDYFFFVIFFLYESDLIILNNNHNYNFRALNRYRDESL